MNGVDPSATSSSSTVSGLTSNPPSSLNCPFCLIIADKSPAYRLYENDLVIAILDILPLRAGHILVIPKAHYPRLSELPSEYAAATGKAVSEVANALTKTMNNTGLNVVCNQEYAQAVPHVHYHIVPAPQLNSSAASLEAAGKLPIQGQPHAESPFSYDEMHRREFEARDELSDDFAEVFTKKFRANL